MAFSFINKQILKELNSAFLLYASPDVLHPLPSLSLHLVLPLPYLGLNLRRNALEWRSIFLLAFSRKKLLMDDFDYSRFPDNSGIDDLINK